VRLRLDTLEDQTIILQTAVQRGGRGLFVYVVKDDMTVTARPVTLGPVDGPRVAVLKGVEPGDQVVIEGIDRLREGARVQITKRPEFKPTIDGTSGPRKKGKGKGKGKGDATAGKAAAGAEPAGASAADAAEKGAGDDERRARRRAAQAQDDKGAERSADAAAEGGGDEPRKKKGRRKPPEGEEGTSTLGPPAETKTAPAAEGGEEPRKKKGRRTPPPEGQEGDPAKAPAVPAPGGAS
jgi:hypothetical protein